MERDRGIGRQDNREQSVDRIHRAHHPLPPSLNSVATSGDRLFIPGSTTPCLQLCSGPTRGRKYMQTEQLFTLAFAAMVVVLVLGFASMYH